MKKMNIRYASWWGLGVVAVTTFVFAEALVNLAGTALSWFDGKVLEKIESKLAALEDQDA